MDKIFSYISFGSRIRKIIRIEFLVFAVKCVSSLLDYNYDSDYKRFDSINNIYNVIYVIGAFIYEFRFPCILK